MNTDENGKEVVKEKPQIYFKNIRFNDDTELMLEKNSIVVFTGANNSGKSQVLKDIESSLDCTNHIERECFWWMMLTIESIWLSCLKLCVMNCRKEERNRT